MEVGGYMAIGEISSKSVTIICSPINPHVDFGRKGSPLAEKPAKVFGFPSKPLTE